MDSVRVFTKCVYWKKIVKGRIRNHLWSSTWSNSITDSLKEQLDQHFFLLSWSLIRSSSDSRQWWEYKIFYYQSLLLGKKPTFLELPTQYLVYTPYSHNLKIHYLHQDVRNLDSCKPLFHIYIGFWRDFVFWYPMLFVDLF